MADAVFWFLLTVGFLLMGALTQHFWVALLVTIVGAVANLLPYFYDDGSF
jgi:hypothetical protein